MRSWGNKGIANFKPKPCQNQSTRQFHLGLFVSRLIARFLSIANWASYMAEGKASMKSSVLVLAFLFLRSALSSLTFLVADVAMNPRRQLTFCGGGLAERPVWDVLKIWSQASYHKQGKHVPLMPCSTYLGPHSLSRERESKIGLFAKTKFQSL